MKIWKLTDCTLNIMYTLKNGESYNTDPDKHIFTSMLLAGFKQVCKYKLVVRQNYSEYITEVNL